MMTTASPSTKVWMPLYIADYLADTSRLTTEQHGAYLLLMFDYWRNGALPDDDAVLAQVCRLSMDAWSVHRATIRAMFTAGDDGLLHHKRVDEELAKAQQNRTAATSKASKAAAARWAKRGVQNDVPAAPDAKPEAQQSASRPAVIPFRGSRSSSAHVAKKSDRKSQHGGRDGDVDRVYQAYRIKKAPGAAKAAIGKALDKVAARGETDPAGYLVSRVEAWEAQRLRDEAAGRFVPTRPYPATFFNQERYDEEGLQPQKNCILPGGEMGTAEELQAQSGWEVVRELA